MRFSNNFEWVFSPVWCLLGNRVPKLIHEFFLLDQQPYNWNTLHFLTFWAKKYEFESRLSTWILLIHANFLETYHCRLLLSFSCTADSWLFDCHFQPYFFGVIFENTLAFLFFCEKKHPISLLNLFVVTILEKLLRGLNVLCKQCYHLKHCAPLNGPTITLE